MDNLTAGNPVAHRVRVYYTGDDTLYEGEPLCYSFKTTKNWFGGSVSDAGVVSATTTTAEGSHNESKYMCVESPMRISLSSDTPADSSKTITGTTTDFDALHKGMFVSISGTDVTNGNYEITAISRSTESAITNSTITLDMTAATGTTADVATTIDNISAFAGVVAKGGWVGRAGPRVIDIYVPNGAVVPVRNDQNCVLGRTILAINSNEQYLTAPLKDYARPVAIAWETVDTATTTGLCLAKLDPNIFIYQKSDNSTLLVDDEDTGQVVLNRIDATFSQATGNCTALWVQALSTAGAASSGYGLAAYFEGDITGVASAHCPAIGMWMNLTGGTQVATNLSVLEVGLYEDGATLTNCGLLSVVSLTHQVADAPKANMFSWLSLIEDGAEHADQLIYTKNLVDLPATAVTGTITLTTGDFLINVYCSAESTKQYYIPLVTNRTTG